MNAIITDVIDTPPFAYENKKPPKIPPPKIPLPTNLYLQTSPPVKKPAAILMHHFTTGSSYHASKVSSQSSKRTILLDWINKMKPSDFAETLDVESDAMFAAAMERPPAFWNHATSNAEHDALAPPYGFGHLYGPEFIPAPDSEIPKKENTKRCKFAVDTMCSPISVISSAMVSELNLKTRTKSVTTSLADKKSKIVSSLIAEFDLMIYWNAKRRSFKLEAMVWDNLPANQDLIIGMPDALSTGLIAFALPHEWRKSWLGTACFEHKLGPALKLDKSQSESQHFEFIMSKEDEELIDIGHILENPHICKDLDTLSDAARYWLSIFPNLNLPIPETAHPDLPKFDPPFDPAFLETYNNRKEIKIPRPSVKMGDKIDSTLGKLSDAKILNLHQNPVGMASFIVLVPKPDGTLRICCNFSKVNKALLVNHYPLPNCQDLLNQVSRKKFYTKIDLLHGFYNFDMAERAKWLTATIAPGHAMTWNKVPQGLATVPSWFQWVMTTVLGNLVKNCCMIYIDDLIIFGDTKEEIHENTRRVLERLDSFNFRINIAKCQLEPVTSIDFLGHTISYDSIKAGPKTAKILENIANPNHESKPKDKRDKLNTLVGVLNWFSRYIADLPRRMKPLLDAKLGGNWNWGDAQNAAFEDLRNALSTMDTLYLPSGKNKLQIHTDASRDGWFAVLFEDTGIGKTPSERLRVVAMTGGVFRNCQLGWSILQKEAHAMFMAHKKFDPYIRLSAFTLCIDNKTLCYMENSSDAMVMRWYLRIQQYSSDIIHIPGSSNVAPDAGSRLMHLIHPINTAAQFCALFSECNEDKKSVDSTLLTTALLDYELDTISETLTAEIQNDQIDDDWMHRSIHTCSESICTHATTQELNFGVLNPIREDINGGIDEQLQQHRLQNWLQQGDSFAKSLPSFNSSVSPAYEKSAAQSTSSVSTTSTRSLPITAEHYNMIRSCHNAACGHFGRDETIRKLQRNNMNWNSRFIDVARYIASCPQCQKTRLKLQKPQTAFKTILNNAPLFGRWHMDFLGIRNRCQFNNSSAILIMVEERSRYVMLWPVQDETSMEVLMCWLQTFAIFGIPEYLYSDGQSTFTSDCIVAFRELCGITHDFSIPKQAHTNGLAETNCKEVGKLLRMLCDELHLFSRWSLLVPIIQRQLNCLTRTTLGCTANDIVFGPRANLERYIIPCAPEPLSEDTLQDLNTTDAVRDFIQHQVLAQSILLAKADAIQTKLINNLKASQPVDAIKLKNGSLVLAPWNDGGNRPFKLAPDMMGPYVVTILPGSENTVALSHVQNPAPPKQPQTFISSISCLRIFDDLQAIELYDLPDNIFRQIAFNNLPIDCILDKRPLRILQDPDNSKDVRNFEYSVRWKVDSEGLSFPENPSWCTYKTIAHTFAFDSFYRFNHRTLNSHECSAIPNEIRITHQAKSRASVASLRI